MKRISMILAIAVLVLFFASAAEAKENAMENKSDQIAKATMPIEAISASSPEMGFILNNSSTTICPEEDNINIPIYGQNVTEFRIIATHPTYIQTNIIDKGKNCTNCPNYVNFTTKVKKIYDDKRCGHRDGNRDTLVAQRRGNGCQCGRGHIASNVTYFRIYKFIAETHWEYPQVFVLYEDGNARIIPQPPPGFKNVTFGSSVILGATENLGRQFVDIDRVEIDPQNLSMKIIYEDKTTAHVELHVNRSQNIVEVSNITYDTTNHPFARFRSMWVKDGNSDTDHIRTEDEVFPIMRTPTELKGTWWQFFREVPSIHNTYCPDIKIEVVTQTPVHQRINETQ